MTVQGAAEGPVLRRSLGLPGAVTFGLAYMLPLTVFTTFGIVNQLTEGHLPVAYIITLCAMLFTASSYALMVRAIPLAGSAYTYTRKTMGERVGFMSGWALLLDYLVMPLLTFLVIGIYLSESIPVIPQWVWIIGSAILVTALNIFGIKLVSNVAMVLLAFQAVFLLVFAAMALSAAAGNPMPSILDAFTAQGPGVATLFGGAAILCLSFLGFDAVSSLAEETVQAREIVPRAIIIVTLTGGVLFIAISLLSNYVFPDFSAYRDVDSAALDVVYTAGGFFLESFFTAAYIAGCFAAVLASQSTAARILYTMGRDGKLPRKIFGKLHPRYQTPARASLVVGAIGLGALFLDLDLVSSLISFGALTAFTMVNMSVIKHYFIDLGLRSGKDRLRYLIAPLIGVALCLWLWSSLSTVALIAGALWIVIGAIYMACRMRGASRATAVEEAETVDVTLQGGKNA